MTDKTTALYRKWRKLAENGYGTRRVDTPSRMEAIDARVRKAKVAFEKALAAEKGKKYYA